MFPAVIDIRHGRRSLVLPAALVIVGALSIGRSRADGMDPQPEAPSPPAGLEAAPPGDQGAPEEDRPYWRHNLFRRFLSDQKYLFTTWWPYEIRRPAFSVPLLAGTATAWSSSRDEGESPDLQTERRFSDWTADRNPTLAHALTDLGDGAVGAVLIGTTYLIGRWSGHDKLSEASSLSAEALLDVGLWSVVLKEISARARPAGGGQGNFFDFHPAQGQSPDSFPSGHAMGAFAVATVFAEVYRDHRWVPWLAYGTAGLVGVSRVALGRHFPSDVLVGGVLGNSFGRMVVTRQGEGERRTSRFEPYTDPVAKQSGLLWTMTW